MARIERVNFIEREPFSFTYQRIGIAAGLLAGLLVLVLSVQVVRGVLLAKENVRLTDEVTHLKMEKERRLRQLVSEGEGGGSSIRSLLAGILDQAVNWSTLFKDLTNQAPDTLWLTTVKMQAQPVAASGTSPSQAAAPSTTPSPSKPEAPRPISIPVRRMTLTGFSGEAIWVTQFVRSLGTSYQFEAVVLKELRQEKAANGFIYSFTIDLAVSAIKKGGA